MATNETDCRTEHGKTVGLIDNIINSVHILSERDIKADVVQEALKDLYSDPELLKIMHGDVFVGKNAPKDVEYKAGTILTDGEVFVRIGYVLEKDWTPMNNYGRKRADYENCTHWPKSHGDNPKGYYSKGRHLYSGSPGSLPGLWLQPGYHLQDFRPIDEGIIREDILRHLTT